MASARMHGDTLGTRSIAIFAPDEEAALRSGIEDLAFAFPKLAVTGAVAAPRDDPDPPIRRDFTSDTASNGGWGRNGRWWRVTAEVRDRRVRDAEDLPRPAAPGPMPALQKLSRQVLGGERAIFELLGYPRSEGDAKMMLRLLERSVGKPDPLKALEEALERSLDLQDDDDDEDSVQIGACEPGEDGHSVGEPRPEAASGVDPEPQAEEEANIMTDHWPAPTEANSTITCTRCKAEKPLNEFTPSTREKGSGWCKACSREAQRERRAKKQTLDEGEPGRAEGEVGDPATLRCSKCGEDKPAERFTPSRRKRESRWCKDCEAENKRAKRAARAEEQDAAEGVEPAKVGPPPAEPSDSSGTDHGKSQDVSTWQERFTNPTLDELEALRDFLRAPSLDDAAMATRLLATTGSP